MTEPKTETLRQRTRANMGKHGIPAGLGLPSEADQAMDEYFRSKPFEWCWPRVTVYVPGDTRPRGLLNRYPHNVIGAAVVLFGRCWGVQWKQSKGARRRKSCRRCDGRGWNWLDTPEGEAQVACAHCKPGRVFASEVSRD